LQRRRIAAPRGSVVFGYNNNIAGGIRPIATIAVWAARITQPGAAPDDTWRSPAALDTLRDRTPSRPG
jgi:hypothetical protein